MAKKTILLISPQAWGNVFVSKHHYALVLEEMGYKVYFLDPPLKNSTEPLTVTRVHEDKDLYIIQSAFRNNLFLRYHFGILYSWLVKRWIKKLLLQLSDIDIIWCFETNIFRDFSIFGLRKKIFHVVDPIDEKLTGIAATADLTVCISNRILKQFDNVVGKKIFVNHGLSKNAIQQAKSIDFEKYIVPARLQAGYVGNLSRAIIDTGVIYNIARDNPSIDFHFWGPGTESNLGGETLLLINDLRHLKNVFFNPPVSSMDLINTIKGMDIFLLAYKKVKGAHDASNAHKILEYLATGKLVVSTYIDQYNAEKFENLLVMSPEDENNKLPGIFKTSVDQIATWNSIQKMQSRRIFAVEHSYLHNAAAILSIINE